MGVLGLFDGTVSAADAELIRGHPQAVVVALLGDYGSGDPAEQAVADLIHGWNPAAIFTMGDNVYSGDGADTYKILQRRVVDYYRRFVDSATFYPSLGNHDWGDPGTPLLRADGRGGTTGAWHDTFDLPGNGRYYDVRIGPLHAFVLDDYYLEPDGHLVGSKQARWLERASAASDAPFKFVVHHYAPYVSGRPHMGIRWPFGEWGIDVSFAGHWHRYEHWHVDGVHYVVNGLGGAPIGWLGAGTPGALKRYAANHGASRLTVSPEGALIEFVTVDDTVVDTIVINFGAGAKKGDKGQSMVEAPLPNGQGGPIDVSHTYRSATGRDATIARLYLAVFQRQPDRAGFDYWTGGTVPTAAIAAYFAHSPEFLSRYGSLADAPFLVQVYQNVLGRQPDRAGREYWLGILARGVERGEVVLAFSESAEFRRRAGIAG